MDFVPLQIDGALGIVTKPQSDSRGTLTRVWDLKQLPQSFNLVQSSVVLNPKEATLRGLHYQEEPFSENKMIFCVTGKVFDVIVDLRSGSNTFGMHLNIEIGPQMVYAGVFVPAGCAHGYLTLEPNSILIYSMDKEYSKENSRGLLWSDPKLSISWPMNPIHISDRDLQWPQIF
jgi:dTDP-4-dehydrorhamnose 3,5-epimerase